MSDQVTLVSGSQKGSREIRDGKRENDRKTQYIVAVGMKRRQLGCNHFYIRSSLFLFLVFPTANMVSSKGMGLMTEKNIPLMNVMTVRIY